MVLIKLLFTKVTHFLINSITVIHNVLPETKGFDSLVFFFFHIKNAASNN